MAFKFFLSSFVFSFKNLPVYKKKSFLLKFDASLTDKINKENTPALSINCMLIYTHNFTFQEPKAHKVDNKKELLSWRDETDLLTDRILL